MAKLKRSLRVEVAHEWNAITAKPQYWPCVWYGCRLVLWSPTPHDTVQGARHAARLQALRFYREQMGMLFGEIKRDN